MAPPVWRLIPSFAASGPTHMAVDRWLFEQHCQGHHPPTLRFYTWQPAALSLGYHQRTYPAHWEHLTWEGQPIALVRRPTGGRAVLHQGDLTYAVICSGLPTQRRQSYEYLCEFLIQGWRSLGVELAYGQAGRGYIHNPNCFGSATAADLVTSAGAKLIGSAQARRGDGVLQHGSMRLNQNGALFEQVFGTPAQAAALPATLASQLGAIAQALLTAAATHFQVTFQAQPLSASEWEQILAQPQL